MHATRWSLLGLLTLGLSIAFVLLGSSALQASAQNPTTLPAPTITGIPQATVTSAVAPTATATSVIATTTAAMPDLVVNINASPVTVSSGSILTYTLDVFNVGDAVAGSSTLTATAPAAPNLDSMGAR